MFYGDVSYNPKPVFPKGFWEAFLAELCLPRLHVDGHEES
jgi:hypothetical protein